MTLENFCKKHSLDLDQLSGKQPTYGNQYDAYRVYGTGPVNCLRLEKYGEFGNNVIQLLNAIYLAAVTFRKGVTPGLPFRRPASTVAAVLH